VGLEDVCKRGRIVWDLPARDEPESRDVWIVAGEPIADVVGLGIRLRGDRDAQLEFHRLIHELKQQERLP
jgi:hypothetical protein